MYKNLEIFFLFFGPILAIENHTCFLISSMYGSQIYIKSVYDADIIFGFFAFLGSLL
jgi:hypothetical protein